jgi:hypothetical protein
VSVRIAGLTRGQPAVRQCHEVVLFDSDRLLLRTIALCGGAGDGCFLYGSDLAAFCRLHRNTVRPALERLFRAGLIARGLAEDPVLFGAWNSCWFLTVAGHEAVEALP